MRNKLVKYRLEKIHLEAGGWAKFPAGSRMKTSNFIDRLNFKRVRAETGIRVTAMDMAVYRFLWSKAYYQRLVICDADWKPVMTICGAFSSLGIRQIIEDKGIDNRSVKRALNRLEAAGFITRYSGRKRHWNIYRFFHLKREGTEEQFYESLRKRAAKFRNLQERKESMIELKNNPSKGEYGIKKSPTIQNI